MVHTKSVSFREHAYRRIYMSKPKDMSFSEWLETLAVQRLDQLQGAKDVVMDGAGRIRTSTIEVYAVTESGGDDVLLGTVDVEDTD